MNYKPPADYADRLKRWRLDRKMTMQDVALLADVAIDTIRRLENGLGTPTDLTWAKLREGLPGLDGAA